MKEVRGTRYGTLDDIELSCHVYLPIQSKGTTLRLDYEVVEYV